MSRRERHGEKRAAQPRDQRHGRTAVTAGPGSVKASPAERAASIAAAAAAIAFVALLQVHLLDDGDTWWHLASGRLIAQTHAIAHTDPFSFTARGAPWINRQWLFDLTAYGFWSGGGAAGLALAAGAAFTVGFVALFVIARRRMPAWAAAVLVYLAAQAAVERFTIRPEAVSFMLVALYLLLLDAGPPRIPTAALLVALQVVWANSHALSVLGVVILATELVGRLLTSGRAALGPLAVATAAAGVAEAATPFGVEGAIFPLRLLGVVRGAEVTSRAVVEHRPPVLAELSPATAAGFVLLLALAALAIVASWRRWRWSHVLVAIGFTWLALLARRNVALLGPGLVPLIAAGLGPAALALERRRSWIAPALASIVALGLLVESARVVTGRYYDSAHLTRTFGLGVSRLLFPEDAVAYLDRERPDGRVFNDDGLGGYLIWQSRRPVFIDGRLQVYPAEVYSEYQTVLDDPRQFAALAQRREIDAVILYHPAPGRLELAGAIARLPGWRIAYIGAGGIVLVAGNAPAPIDGTSEPIVAGTGGRFESALMHYQRGRATLYLLGRNGVDAARADFTAALALDPSLDDARIGLEAIGRVRP